MSLLQILEHRRSVRDYLPTPIDPNVVKECLRLATLAPTSSNMQLYEFYHVTDRALLDKLAVACLSQGAARTAQQMVVFVVRPDLHRQRAKAVWEFEKENIKTYSPVGRQAQRLKQVGQYYNQLMPLIYSQRPLLPVARQALAQAVSIFRPTFDSLSDADIQTVMHKSCGLVAQTFMLAMSEQGLDTCPMEGFDSSRVKQLLNLPKDSQINMVVSCGLRSDKGVWGERFRVPFETVYRQL